MSNRKVMLIGALFTVLISVLYVRSRYVLVELSYKITDSYQVRESLRHETQLLELELSTLQSPSRIEKYARKHLKISDDIASDRVTLHGFSEGSQ